MNFSKRKNYKVFSELPLFNLFTSISVLLSFGVNSHLVAFFLILTVSFATKFALLMAKFFVAKLFLPVWIFLKKFILRKYVR